MLSAIEPKIAKGTLRPGWRASPARFTGTLEAVVAEDDAAGGNRGEDGGDIPDMPPAVDAHLEILPVKAGEHQRDGGGRPARSA